jgi:hypothetical protein
VLNFGIHLHNRQQGLDDTEWSAGWRDETLLRLHADADTLTGLGIAHATP